MKRKIRKIFSILIPIMVGAICLWMTKASSTWAVDKKDALCVLELPEGNSKVEKNFTISNSLERFFVVINVNGRNEKLSITITGKNDFLCKATLSQSPRFSFSPKEIPPGTYTATLSQETGTRGGWAVIADKQLGLSGWQILSRVFLVLFIFSGLSTLLFLKSQNKQIKTASLTIFHSLLLALTAMFIYLLLHEGGHAIASGIFGVFDWNRSDFFGIHGRPHSGRIFGSQVEPWQQAIISIAGPLFPTLIGWVLFILWQSKPGKRLRSMRPLVNIYFTAIVGICVFPFVVVLGYLTKMTSDGDWRGFIENVPGPVWLMKVLIFGVFIVNCFILYPIVSELWRLLKILKAKTSTTALIQEIYN